MKRKRSSASPRASMRTLFQACGPNRAVEARAARRWWLAGSHALCRWSGTFESATKPRADARILDKLEVFNVAGVPCLLPRAISMHCRGVRRPARVIERVFQDRPEEVAMFGLFNRQGEVPQLRHIDFQKWQRDAPSRWGSPVSAGDCHSMAGLRPLSPISSLTFESTLK
jgi:hypothetical protein